MNRLRAGLAGVEPLGILAHSGRRHTSGRARAPDGLTTRRETHVQTIETRPWRKLLAPYQQPSHRRSVLEIALTAAPLALIWTAAWFAADAGLWPVALALSVPAAFFVVRMFLIQHDCGHHAFFRAPALNDWVGRAIGVLTLTPYDCWRKEHAIHHATSGDLDRRGVGAIETLTVEEYRSKPALGRLWYRVYRHPLFLFVVGPFIVFFLQQRLPVGLMKEGWRPWVSALGTNVGLAAVVGAILWAGGWEHLLLVFGPTLLLAGSIGVWLFYVQHQFEETHWSRHADWNHQEAALRGSSHYVLPPVLRWLTADIGVHHVHHMASRVPFYRLQAVLRDHPELREVSRVTLWQSLRTVSLTLWDESRQKLVSFREARRMMTPAAA
jgi:acyl-lipid omega-6 desaturase (Delta-12 desaturase)